MHPLADAYCARPIYLSKRGWRSQRAPTATYPSNLSLRHCRSTEASMVPKQPFGGGSKGTALRLWQYLCRLCSIVLWSLGGKGRVLTLWREDSGRLDNAYGEWGWLLHLGPCLAETTVSSGHATPFNLGSKHGVCRDSWEYFVVTYDNSSYVCLPWTKLLFL